MEGSVTAPSEISGEKAERIVEAMRQSVAHRGVAGSTFDHVAREAGVSRGLLHYYFGTKERLLVEVVRRESDRRLAELDEQIASAGSADALLHTLSLNADLVVRSEPSYVMLAFELFTLAQRNEEVAAGYRDLVVRTREHLAATLRAKEAEGVVRLKADADAIAELLFSIADGVAMRIIAEPERDFRGVVAAALLSLRVLLDDA